MTEYLFFWAGILSNWYLSPFKAKLMSGKEVKFNCAEQYMMAQKALTFHDTRSFDAIMKSGDARKQKELGRGVKNYDDASWAAIREVAFYPGLLAKFEQNKTMNNYLLSTGDKIIVEASPYDKIWGIGMKEGDKGIENPENWKGQNLLGKMLMQVRKDLAVQCHSIMSG